MTPREALLDLVARVGARDGAAVRISETDVRQWPARGRLGPQGAPAPGPGAACQDRGVSRLRSRLRHAGADDPPPGRARRHASSSVTNGVTSTRVALTTAHVDQWKCDAEALARFVVAQLGLRRSRHRIDDSGTRPLGLAAGDTRHQMLGLRTHGDVTLVVADTAVALADLIDFERGAYVLDTAVIRHLVDAATTADPRYTPSTTRREARTLGFAGAVRALADGPTAR